MFVSVGIWIAALELRQSVPLLSPLVSLGHHPKLSGKPAFSSGCSQVPISSGTFQKIQKQRRVLLNEWPGGSFWFSCFFRLWNLPFILVTKHLWYHLFLSDLHTKVAFLSLHVNIDLLFWLPLHLEQLYTK